jgi:hypothetical protein
MQPSSQSFVDVFKVHQTFKGFMHHFLVHIGSFDQWLQIILCLFDCFEFYQALLFRDLYQFSTHVEGLSTENVFRVSSNGITGITFKHVILSKQTPLSED